MYLHTKIHVLFSLIFPMLGLLSYPELLCHLILILICNSRFLKAKTREEIGEYLWGSPICVQQQNRGMYHMALLRDSIEIEVTIPMNVKLEVERYGPGRLTASQKPNLGIHKGVRITKQEQQLKAYHAPAVWWQSRKACNLYTCYFKDPTKYTNVLHGLSKQIGVSHFDESY